MRTMPLQSTSKYGYLSLINTANVKNVIFDYNFINHPFINFHFAASLGRKRRVEKMRERERENSTKWSSQHMLSSDNQNCKIFFLRKIQLVVLIVIEYSIISVHSKVLQFWIEMFQIRFKNANR